MHGGSSAGLLRNGSSLNHDAAEAGQDEYVTAPALGGPDPFKNFVPEPNPVKRALYDASGKARYYAQHAYREMKKRKFNYCLGVSSVFMVVVIAALCYTMIAKAPVIFLAQGESDFGQMDVFMTPIDDDNSNSAPFLNYSQVAINAEISEEFAYHSARISMTVAAYDKACSDYIESLQAQNRLPGGKASSGWRYKGFVGVECSAFQDCMPDICPSIRSYKSVSIHLIDTAREARMSLGRNWPYPALKAGEIIIEKSMAARRGLRKGDELWLSIDMGSFETPLLPHLVVAGLRGEPVQANSSQQMLDAARDYRIVVAMFNIVDVMPSVYGKFKDSEKDVMIAEMGPFLSYFQESVHPVLFAKQVQRTDGGANLTFTNVMARANLEHFVKTVVLNFPPNRVTPYLQSSYDTTQNQVLKFASRAMYFIGFPAITTKLGILDSLRELRFFTLYLNLILSIILTILFILAAMLIYSLLLISIETRTFELGVHRMVGMTRIGIIQMLLAQALSYAVPAWLFGLLIAQVLSYMVLAFIESTVEVPVDKGLTSDAVGIATFLGLFIPLVAATVPIRNALGKNLQESLDTMHSKTLAVKVSIERSEDATVSTAWVVTGTALVVFGFLIYYLLPLALLTFNLALFFNIFFGILLGLLFGLILLSLNLEHMVEKLVAFVFLWWEHRSVRGMTLKNLVAHRMRNRKTTIMYALSLGFIIFITVAFTIELSTAAARVLRDRGAEFKVAASNDALFYKQEINALESLAAADPAVEDWTWVGRRLDGATDEIADTILSNLGHIQEGDTQLIGVAPNFYDVAVKGFTTTAGRERNTGLSLSEFLYTYSGSQSALISASYKLSHNFKAADASSSFLMINKHEPKDGANYVDIRRMMPAAFLETSPVFIMSRFPTARSQAAVVSFPTLLRLANGTLNSIEDLGMRDFLIKWRGGATDAQKDEFLRKINTLKDSYSGWDVFDYRDFKGGLDRANGVMSIIFTIATYIAMFLCLFSLMASMYTNIFEQSKEIAILRAMGMTRSQIVRIYIYEAFVLVMAASVLGVMIGTIMAWTMMLQRVLFTQLPVPIQFPYMLLLFVILGAAVCAVLASCGPARRLVSKTVAQVMRTVV